MRLESCVSNTLSFLPKVLDGSDAGQTSQLPKDDRLMVTQKEFLADIDVALGGRVAEELVFGPENVTSGASSDLRKATATATHMVKASQVHPTLYQCQT
jgi:ATP-dependent Zn protease